MDFSGEVHSLSRLLGVKVKDVRAKLGSAEGLSDVEATKQLLNERMTPALRRHVERARTEFKRSFAPIVVRKTSMTERHRAERTDLAQRLDGEWQVETRSRAARMPRGLRALWHRVSGRFSETRQQNEREAEATRARHAAETERLVERQLAQRASLQIEIKELRNRQATQLRELRREMSRFSLRRPDGAERARKQTVPFAFSRQR